MSRETAFMLGVVVGTACAAVLIVLVLLGIGVHL